MEQMSREFAALIPARGGSKGIPRKNIKVLLGKPLIYWVCKAAEESSVISALYLSTDDQEIARVVLSFGFRKLHLVERSPESATDSASTEMCMLEFAKKVNFENVMLLQATSPLVRSEDIEGAAKVFETGNFDSVLSVVRQKRFIWKENKEGTIRPENYDPGRRPKRQEQEGFLVENGAIYVISRKTLLERSCRVGEAVGYIEMPADTYLELDEVEDWTIVEALLERRLCESSSNQKESACLLNTLQSS
jgi:CMP-N-acetylneuraminic acid synthetase